jgi:predicted CXXCH cytochrome family protein
VQRHQNPIERYRAHTGAASDSSIVNPAKLDHRRSSQVCGQCHGVFIFRDEFAMQSAREGPLYQPGEDLHRARYYVQHPANTKTQARLEDLKKNPDFFRKQWWDDGTILAAGREYTAMAVSGCYRRGQISCLSCHSMHDSDPVDQLKPGLDGSAACIQCHREPKYNRDITSHTFHRAGSSGSDCLNCHMPHTSYALFGAIRSHQIGSPNLESSARFGVPNACNLCHLDKTLAWTQTNLIQRYGGTEVALTDEQKSVSAALLWLLKGHAAQRVITAWHLGWAPAQRTSGADWLAPFQARLLADPYGVVRYVAEHNLRKLPGFDAFRYDFLASESEWQRHVAESLQQWNARAKPPSRVGAEVLLHPDGTLMEKRIDTLLRERDNRPVSIAE